MHTGVFIFFTEEDLRASKMTLHLGVLIDVKDEFVLMERDDQLGQVLLLGVKFGQIKLHFVS